MIETSRPYRLFRSVTLRLLLASAVILSGFLPGIHAALHQGDPTHALLCASATGSDHGEKVVDQHDIVFADLLCPLCSVPAVTSTLETGSVVLPVPIDRSIHSASIPSDPTIASLHGPAPPRGPPTSLL